MTSPTADERSAGRRTGQTNGQVVPSKALGAPTVYVEAVDADGAVVVEKIESEVALLWPFVQKEVVLNKRGKTADTPVQLPKQVGQDILALLLEYCRYHRFPGRSDKERKLFDEKFIRLDTRRLCELTSAADSLDMKPLVDLSSRALARMIEGKSPEEIRETFHLPDDLTEEEKLEPVRNLADDPRIRLLNRLYAKKRKELAEKKAELLRKENGHPDPTPVHQDTRSVEELLSFIEEERQGQGKARPKRKKPKKKRDGSHEPGGGGLGREIKANKAWEGQPMSALEAAGDEGGLQSNEEQDNGDDPEEDAELDSEIEAFKRSLSTDWEDRRTELILMAGAYQCRPTRVTTLTSLSNFRARPRESAQTEDGGQDSPSWQSMAAEGPSTPSAEPSGRAAGEEPPAEAPSISQAPHQAGIDPKALQRGGKAVVAEESEPGVASSTSAEQKDDHLEKKADHAELSADRGNMIESGREGERVRSPNRHRKAVPTRVAGQGPEQPGNEAAAEKGEAGGMERPHGDYKSSPAALAELLQGFVDRLGFSSCIDVVVKSADLPVSTLPVDDRVLLQKRISGVGVLKLQRMLEHLESRPESS